MATTCDTSVLVPALLAWHPDHAACRRAVTGSVDTVPAHVLLECYSVLTRLPAPHRLAAADAAQAVGALPWKPLTLPAGRHRDIVMTLARDGIRGGAVYDALVAATALHHDRLLLTRDRRARSTYDVIGVRHTLV
ncbi:type II toxin-antitoxin system VapC family toxin [Nocardioides jensenii]|uniref:type II toxin-antitoxin system VapC family toxin n=1 Tax=Nocardioides jensenii TaxID=1843 RepID=UPI0008353647|nr:type II toxin-antitoxin system VapC family toxin [Nocardioides jensenii]